MTKKPSDSESQHESDGSDDNKASKEYLKDYLKKVYGVSISGIKSIQTDLTQSGQHQAFKIVADEFIFRLLARFNDLDVAPTDGFISRAELEFACNNPRLHFDDKDKHMLQILKQYYVTVKEAAAANDPNSSPHHGISRHDLETISTSTSKSCVSLRKRLEQEFAVKEHVQ